ncbi:MAG: hypothetical protein KOO62_02515 [candidate division Zixibacteria bacterium]|nr:hypothetical protein [candidate division Zixibacteria bacterium]
MEKELGRIKVTETDDGYRIDVNGKDLKGLCLCGCSPQESKDQSSATSCCEPTKEKK